MEEQQPEMFTVDLARRDSGISWGFRLQGGVDFNTPLSVQVVQPKSVAERCGLRAGDGIIKINNANTDELSHEQAKMEIIRSCNDMRLTIVRGAVQIWKPKVTKISELKPQELQPIRTATGDDIYAAQKTSLAKESQDETCTIGNSYNRSARPFAGFGAKPAPPQQQQQQQPQYGGGQPQYGGGQPQYGGGQPQYGGGQPQYGGGQPQYGGGQPQYGGGQPQYGGGPQSPKRAVPNIVHAQFNSPMGLYSANNIAQTYAAQTEGINQQVQNMDVSSEPVGSRMTGTYQRLDSDQGQGGGFRSVSAPTGPPPGAVSAPKQESMHCAGCGNLVTGVFVRIKGQPYHEKCFKCFNCGMFLKQKGYFMIEGQLYCETHARRAAQPPGDNMRSAGAVYR